MRDPGPIIRRCEVLIQTVCYFHPNKAKLSLITLFALVFLFFLFFFFYSLFSHFRIARFELIELPRLYSYVIASLPWRKDSFWIDLRDRSHFIEYINDPFFEDRIENIIFLFFFYININWPRDLLIVLLIELKLQNIFSPINFATVS